MKMKVESGETGNSACWSKKPTGHSIGLDTGNKSHHVPNKNEIVTKSPGSKCPHGYRMDCSVVAKAMQKCSLQGRQVKLCAHCSRGCGCTVVI